MVICLGLLVLPAASKQLSEGILEDVSIVVNEAFLVFGFFVLDDCNENEESALY
jgi:hypothetical protein